MRALFIANIGGIVVVMTFIGASIATDQPFRVPWSLWSFLFGFIISLFIVLVIFIREYRAVLEEVKFLNRVTAGEINMEFRDRKLSLWLPVLAGFGSALAVFAFLFFVIGAAASIYQLDKFLDRHIERIKQEQLGNTAGQVLFVDPAVTIPASHLSSQQH